MNDIFKKLLNEATTQVPGMEGLGGCDWEEEVYQQKFAALVWNAAINECIAQLEYRCSTPKEPIKIINKIKV
jgi:hypothetical protein